MKRMLIYFVLGLAVVCFLFVGGIRTKVQLTDQAQKNMTILSSTAMNVAEQFKAWLFDDQEETQLVMCTLERLSERESLVDYDAALKIVQEIIEDLDNLFTTSQKQAIEKEVNKLHKQTILKEYKDQIGPSYYE